MSATIAPNAALIATATEMLADVGHSGKAQAGRIQRLSAVLADHPEAVLIVNTNIRYGDAQKRANRTALIGRTNHGMYRATCVWAEWPAATMDA
jgi:hypothetical protein